MILRLSVTIALTVVFATLTTALSACSATEAQLDAHATRVAGEIYASLEAGATIPPATRELTPPEIYTRVAPSIAYIETEYGTGSGFLVEDDGQRYVVTNMHVVWPQESARVVFPDGVEYLDIPLIDWDMMLDLAVLGPIDTDLPASPLGNGEELVIGSDIYLIGYPNEEQLFPQPALARGLLSRQRERTNSGLTYFQSDAPTMGGQSGGVMVAADGTVIGVTGMSYGDVFAIAMSMPDLEGGSIHGLIAGEDVDGLGKRRLPTRARRILRKFELEHIQDTQMYLFDGEDASEFEVTAESDNDVGLILVDSIGEFIASADETWEGRETLTTTLPYADTMFLIVNQYTASPADVRIATNTKLTRFDDPDDEREIRGGAQIVGNIDYPTDSDAFLIDLEAGHPITITADSELVTPDLSIGEIDALRDEYIFGETRGDGQLGSAASLVFTPVEDGPHLIVVSGFYSDGMGGYRLDVELADGSVE